MLASWLHRWFPRRVRTARPRRRSTIRLRPDVLEDRTLPSTLTVLNNLDRGAGSLRDAIAAAASGDTIVFSPGLNGRTITLTGGELLLNKDLTLTGPGARLLTSSGNDASRVFEVASDATVFLSGLTIAHAQGDPAHVGEVGGGILNQGTLTVSDSVLTGNSTDTAGGGIFNFGTLTVSNCTLTANAAYFGAGLWNDQGTLIVANSTLAGNVADSAGAGIFNFGTLAVSNSTLAGNVVTGHLDIDDTGPAAGGGIVNDGTLLANNTILAGNTAPVDPAVYGSLGSRGHNLVGNPAGGSGFASTDLLNLDPLLSPLQDNGGPTPTMALLPGSPAIQAGGFTVLPETDQRGFPRPTNSPLDIGAFQVQRYVVTSTADSGDGSLRTALTNADQAGGSVITFTTSGTINLASPLPDISRSVRILGAGADNLTVRRATGGDYRVFTVDRGTTVTIDGLTIAGGHVGDTGGGIRNHGTLTVSDSTLAGNVAHLAGGGIYNDGTLTVSRSTLKNNSTFTLGGGIENYLGTATVSGSTLAGNSAHSGGGIANDGTLTVSGCTLAGNSAHSGGGIENDFLATVSDSTLAGNSAAEGGGLFATNISIAMVTVRDTILAGNTAPAGPDLFGKLDSLGHNLIGNPAGGAGFDPGDRVGVNPLLGPLQDNGGPTQTMALLPGSPAIDAGAGANAPDTDQRGLPRVAGAALDIGAFESRGFAFAVAGGDSQAAGVGTAFGQPLVVSVASPYGEPVQGGVVTFTAPATGPAATFPGGGTAVLDASGHASISAQANASAGPYTLTATAAGAGSVVFHLSNQVPAVPAFSGLAAPTIVYGTPMTVLGGTLTAGVSIPPGVVVITLNGVSETAALNPTNGRFAAPFDTHLLHASGAPYAITYPITYAYTGDGVSFASAGAQATLGVLQATPTVTWANPADIVYGTPLGASQLDATADVPGAFDYTPAAGAVLPAGGGQALSVTFLPADGTDYVPVQVGATLTVGQAPLTVTADSQTVTQGAALPPLTGTLTGVVNGDGITATYSTAAADTSQPGLYAIAPTLLDPNGRLGNYAVTSTAGTLTVVAPSVTGASLDDGTGQAAGQVTATGQHSMERRIVLPLSGPLPGLSDGQALAFADAGTVTVGGLVLSLVRQGGPAFGVVAMYSAHGGSGPTLTLTLTGGTGASLVVGGSLADGNYTLAVNGQVVASFYRLFGESNGDRQVDVTDLAAFLKAYRSRKGMANYAGYFDYNNDGMIDSTDYFQFLRRFKTRLNADGTTTSLP